MKTRLTPRQEINKIMKDVKRYKQTTDLKIKLLNIKIIKLQKMIEKNRILEEGSPDEYEIKAIKNFESKKKVEYLSLDSLN